MYCLSNSRTNDVVMFGPFKLFVTERLLKKGDEAVLIGGRALDVLITLVERAGEVISHKELIARVWPEITVERANLRVHIAALRKVLGDGLDGARYVSNVAGRGYCFVAAVVRYDVERPLAQMHAADIASPTRKLPARLSRMVGRDETVRTLMAKLMACRFVSIVGPGGVGKTTVAVAAAHALTEDFHGSVFFVDLGALADLRLVPTAVASALGFVTQAEDPMLDLLGFLGDRKVLLVLDNCEHVVDAAAELAERVVNEAPQTHILATTREALRSEGEHVDMLPSLETPPDHPGLSAAEALRYSAVQLFMERALVGGHRSELSDAEAPIVANICRRLDGMALAIELAASRVGSLGIRATAELLDNRFKVIWQGRRTALPRHQTLSSMLDWSYNLLSDLERQVLCRLSTFVGDFTIKAACEVAAEGEVDDALVTHAVTRLLEKSLISTTHFKQLTYYRLLDTTRAYALIKLASRGETDRAAQRHATAFCRYLKEDQSDQSGAGEGDSGEYALHIGNVRAAMDWALSDHGDGALAVELTTCAAPLFIRLSLLDECRRYCKRALAAIGETSRGTRTEMILLRALALSSMFTKGNTDEVRAAIERGLSLAENLNDRTHQLDLLAGLNIFLTRIGDFHGALAVAARANAVAQASNNAAGLVATEWMLGVSHHLAGNQSAAQRHCERGIIQAVELGAFNPKFFGFDHRIRALVALACALWLRGHAGHALRTAQQTIDEAAARGQPVSVCISLIYGALVFLWTGDLDHAASLVDRLIECAELHALAPYRAVGVGLKGAIAVARGQAEVGLELLREALALHSEQHNILLTVFAGALTQGLLKTGQVDEALLTISGAIGRAVGFGTNFHIAELLRLKAEVLAAAPQKDGAAVGDCLRESLRFAREQSALAYELRSATTLARLLSESGRQEEAKNILDPVYSRFTEGVDTRDLQLARGILGDMKWVRFQRPRAIAIQSLKKS
jgi:predicted ATPase/DNA-binding winged helix-turn-helix (wHTH) protein